MKKSLIILVLSMVTGVANASKIELVNTSDFIVKGKIQVVGTGLCGDKWAKVLIGPKQTKIIDAKTCCASRLDLSYAPVPEKLKSTNWGKTTLSEKDLDIMMGVAGGAAGAAAGVGVAAGVAGGIAAATLPTLASGVIVLAAGAVAGYGAAQIRVCGAKERFEIRINEKTKTITAVNVTK